MTGSGHTDEQLLHTYRGGDMAAFDELYARYRQSLYLFLLRRGHDEAVAGDLFHDCWMKVLARKGGFETGNFRAWVFTVARNLSTDAFRRSNLHAVSPFDPDGDAGKQFSTQQVQEAGDCIERIRNSVAALGRP